VSLIFVAVCLPLSSSLPASDIPCPNGTADVLSELEYVDEVVLPSPNPSSYTMPPIENKAPIPALALASTLAESDKENCKRCPLQPISQLVPIEDMVMDRAEDVPRVAEVCPVTKGPHCKHS
jgi:hypothetical protein